MNDRMTELYAKACLDARDIHPTDVPAFISCMAEKFAELLIRECMACSTWVGKMNTNSVEPVHTAHAVNQRIKQHFGVGE